MLWWLVGKLMSYVYILHYHESWKTTQNKKKKNTEGVSAILEKVRVHKIHKSEREFWWEININSEIGLRISVKYHYWGYY